MRSTQPPESWADLAGAVDSHPSLRAAMKNLSGLSRTSKWTMRASRARSHRSSLSASIHEESIHIMLRHLKMSKDVTMQQKNLSSVLLTLVERHQRTDGYMLMATRIEVGDQLSKFIVYTRKSSQNCGRAIHRGWRSTLSFTYKAYKTDASRLVICWKIYNQKRGNG
ncbi:uncharacterized protein LOC125550611 isoform X1 [Triticum urartu]|uniref:Uncharacterized protein n=1 Tax=Triticum urartu TaxID=4572 RepID=A0A8R7U3D0_TRIUA|nr:uncharacterized protein LOC125550611 isoform X1 [Triticum urartu]